MSNLGVFVIENDLLVNNNSLVKGKCKKLCRTCLKSNSQFVFLYSVDETYKKSYANLIMEIAPITIIEEEGDFPDVICSICVNLIRNLYKFQQQCIEADKCIRSSNEKQVSDKDNNEYDVMSPTNFVESDYAIHESNFDTSSLIDIKENNSSNANLLIKDENQSNLSENKVEEVNGVDENKAKIVKTNCDRFKRTQLIRDTAKLHSKGDKPTQCETCCRSYRSHTEFLRHIRRAHLKSGNEDLKTTCFIEQLSSIHGSKDKPTTCVTCNKKYITINMFKRHLQNKHSNLEKKIVKKEPSEWKKRYTYVREIAKEHSKTKPNHCDTCNKTFKVGIRFLLHVKQMHIGMKRACDVCNKVFYNSGNLSRHRKIHLGIKEHVCKYCGKEFTQKSALTEHAYIHVDDGEKFPCSTCGRLFISEHRLYTHRKLRHEPQTQQKGPVECKVCFRKLSSLGGLYRHVKKIHTDEKVTCECGKVFKNKYVLKSHQRYVHDFGLLCWICGKQFAQVNSFDVHMLAHNDLKPYKCKLCSKEFRQRAHLRAHEMTHTGEKPFMCKFCPKSFRHRTTYAHHTRIHTGERPYRCKICDKGFYHSTNMKKHFLSH